MGELYDQKDAEGFINCVGLPIKMRALLDQEHMAEHLPAARRRS
jgi:hypothetical protein